VLEDLKKEGNSLIFLNGVGYATGLESAKLATGFEFKAAASVKGQEVLDDATGLLRGVPVHGGKPVATEVLEAKFHQHWGAVARFDAGNIIVPYGEAAIEVLPDRDTRVIATYPRSSSVALAEKQYEDWRSVFIGSYAIPRQMIHNIAEEFGLWVIAPVNNVVAANEKLLMVHPLLGGKIVLDLGRKGILREIGLGGIESAGGQSDPNLHTLDLKEGHTYLFEVHAD
jgi:hypothetical protein